VQGQQGGSGSSRTCVGLDAARAVNTRAANRSTFFVIVVVFLESKLRWFKVSGYDW